MRKFSGMILSLIICSSNYMCVYVLVCVHAHMFVFIYVWWILTSSSCVFASSELSWMRWHMFHRKPNSLTLVLIIVVEQTGVAWWEMSIIFLYILLAPLLSFSLVLSCVLTYTMYTIKIKNSQSKKKMLFTEANNEERCIVLCGKNILFDLLAEFSHLYLTTWSLLNLRL